MITLSRIFHENQKAFKDNVRYIINQGGTSSTKTFSILQLLVDIARKKKYKIDVLGISIPHLKQGVLTDMPIVCDGFNITFDDRFGVGDKVYKDIGSINFIGIDKLGKAHGGRRDILFINEANHTIYAIVEQLMIRTRIAVFIDFNPTSEFWAQTKLLKNYPDKCRVIRSTYKDNPRLEPAIVEAIEARKGDNNFWRVYGLGEMGRAEGLIYENFETGCKFDPDKLDNYRHGVDWGFSIDPFAYVKIAIDFKQMVIYICYEFVAKNMQNTDTAPIVSSNARYDTVFCDCAEPKSIAEYQSLSINAEGAIKGQGSIETGVRFLQRFRIKVHENCPHTASEFNNYSWKVNRLTGEPLNIPDDSFNHCMDAIRYAVNADLDGGGWKPSISYF